MKAADYKDGDKVRFLPGPRSTTEVTAKVIGRDTSGRFEFLVTKDDAGKERRVAPGRCTKVAA